MKNIVKQFPLSVTVALVLLVYVASIAMAVGSIQKVWATPTSTTIHLRWDKEVVTDNTSVVYKTTGFPASISDGTISYNGTGFENTITGLISGQAYYFAVYEYDGATIGTPMYIVMSTLAADVATGGKETPTNIVPIPTLPSNITQNATLTGFNLQPFTNIIAHFNNAPGGFGMPTENAWESLAIWGIMLVSGLIFIKTRQFFIAYASLLILTIFGVALHVVQGLLVPIELVVGAGVWALEKYYQ